MSKSIELEQIDAAGAHEKEIYAGQVAILHLLPRDEVAWVGLPAFNLPSSSALAAL